MTLNFPGPYELRFAHTTVAGTGGVLTHIMRQNVDLVEPVTQGQLFSTITIKDLTGPATGIFLSQLVEDWLTVLGPLYHNQHSFGAVELWKYPTAQSFDAEFWSSYGPPTAQPSSATGMSEASQNIFTFRSREGGIMKITLMETIYGPGVPLEYAAMTVQQKAVVDFVLAGGVGYNAPFLARDTSYPFSARRLYKGQNEATFKQRFR